MITFVVLKENAERLSVGGITISVAGAVLHHEELLSSVNQKLKEARTAKSFFKHDALKLERS